jgi:primary-amine oxidase
MVLLDDFASVQNIINASSEFAEVLKKHGITDPKSGHHPAHRRLL